MIRTTNIFKQVIFVITFLLFSQSIFAAESSNIASINAVKDSLQNNINIVWTIISAILVFFMQAGFALVEAGFTRSKNSVNIIMKNLMDFSIASLGFFLLGFGLMFGKSNGFIGHSDFLILSALDNGEDWSYTFLLFQTVFAGTAATIVSGAMAERTKFKSYIIYSLIVSAVVYPIFGSWAWGSLYHGSGWLEKAGFIDFAGSTVVHSIGGWLALAGALILGPRIGKYTLDGKPKAILGHNIPLASLGVFILWMGWFGFNAGSTNIGDGNIGRIALTTNLSAAAGSISAMITTWLKDGKPDASMSLNGALAGLVAITAGTANVTPIGSIIIGIIAGILVVISVNFIDKTLKIDDPVGAISVHGVNGAWGTLAVGLFGAEKVLGIADKNSGLLYGGGINQLITQFIGVIAAFVWAFGLGLILFYIIKKTIGLRVSEEEELKGLDIEEHGMEAYHGFQLYLNE